MHNFPTLVLFLSATILLNVNLTESKIVEGLLETKFVSFVLILLLKIIYISVNRIGTF